MKQLEPFGGIIKKDGLSLTLYTTPRMIEFQKNNLNKVLNRITELNTGVKYYLYYHPDPIVVLKDNEMRIPFKEINHLDDWGTMELSLLERGKKNGSKYGNNIA